MVVEAGAGSEDIPLSARLFNADSYLRIRGIMGHELAIESVKTNEAV